MLHNVQDCICKRLSVEEQDIEDTLTHLRGLLRRLPKIGTFDHCFCAIHFYLNILAMLQMLSGGCLSSSLL